MSKDQSLATGIPATHIGPETGGTGSATAGDGSSAGTQEQSVPAGASGLGNDIATPSSQPESSRSFQPRSPAGTSSGAPLDLDNDLRDITDGKNRPDHKQH